MDKTKGQKEKITIRFVCLFVFLFLFLHEMCLGHVLEESELYLIILKKEKKNYAWDTHATVSEEYPALKIHTTQTQHPIFYVCASQV